MSFTFGAQPANTFNRDEAEQSGVWTQSGLIRLRINSAVYAYKMADGTPAPFGFDPLANRSQLKAERIQLRGWVVDKIGSPMGEISFSVFLNDREHMGSLCWFLNLRNERGELCLPDPEHRSGTSMSGRQYDFYSFSALRDAYVYALVEFQGKSRSAAGREYANFRLVGFCDDRGWDAASIVSQAAGPARKYAEFMAAHPQTVPLNAQLAPQPQPQPYGAMAPQAPQGFSYGAAPFGAAPAAPVPPQATIPPQAVRDMQQIFGSAPYGAAPQPQKLQNTADDEIPF